jgi:hypothetical protein
MFHKKRRWTDYRGISYANADSYDTAQSDFKKLVNGKANLETRCNHAEAKVESLSKEQSALNKSLNACHKELERFYLKAIGDCKTVKQVNALSEQFEKSDLYRSTLDHMANRIYSLSVFGTAMNDVKTQNDTPLDISRVLDAIHTKIKRINTRDARQLCTMINAAGDRTIYASSMATTLKGIAGVEVDRTKVLAAKDSGLDAWNVLLSMLVAYGVKADSVLEVK